MPGTLYVIEPGSRELTATCLIFCPLNALFLMYYFKSIYVWNINDINSVSCTYTGLYQCLNLFPLL